MIRKEDINPNGIIRKAMIEASESGWTIEQCNFAYQWGKP